MRKMAGYRKRRSSEENNFVQSKKSNDNPFQTPTFTVQRKTKASGSSVDMEAQLQRARERGFDFSKVSLRAPENNGRSPIQRMTMGKVGDKYEQDADNAGSQFAQSLNQGSPVQRNEMEEGDDMMKKVDPLQRNEMEEGDDMMKKADPLQRNEMEEGDDMMKKVDPLQRNEMEEGDDMMKKADSLQRNGMGDDHEIRGDNGLSLEGGDVSEQFESQVNEEKQRGGESLSLANQKVVQQHLNSDGSNVKVHTSKNANQLCQKAGAKAMTIGNHIMYSNASDYSQNLQGASKQKQELFGHEYRHTEQQGATKAIQQEKKES